MRLAERPDLCLNRLPKWGKCFGNRGKRMKHNMLIVSPSPWKRNLEIKATPPKLAWRWQNWIAIPPEAPRRNNSAGRRSTAFRADAYGDEEILAAIYFIQSPPSTRKRRRGAFRHCRSGPAFAKEPGCNGSHPRDA